jgi:hypothetical protein
MRSLALGLTAAAGLAAAGWLYAAEPPLGAATPGDLAPVPAADQDQPGGKTAKPDIAGKGDGKGDKVHVEAPGTRVTVDRETGKVGVTAPHTEVQVDPEKGRVRVRAPYVDLDIRW